MLLELVQKPGKQTRPDVSLHDCSLDCRAVKGAAAAGNRLGKPRPDTGTPLDVVIMHVFRFSAGLVLGGWNGHIF